ncbi:MAG TPA: tetratricopeptide repeat protein, partial [Phototrophicaceae bacterium]|nr:tetratricopeptide repeat protein [Phototrophicaceae bacterium]
INQEIGNRVNTAINLINLGDVNTHLGHYTAAETYYQQSLALNREIGNKDSIAFCLNGLGIVAVKLDNLVAAQDYYQQALTIWHEIGGKDGTAISLNGLGLVASRQGAYPAAETYYQQALTLYREMEAKSDMVGVLAELAALRYHQRHIALLPTLREALTLSLEVGAPPVILHLLSTAARALAREGKAADAAHLAGLIEVHPATPAEIRQDTLAALKSDLEKQLPAAVLAVYLAEGSALDLVETAQAQLARLGTP